MEYRRLGNSGLMVSALSMGTMTFGGKGNFAKVGASSLNDVRRLIDIVADAGVNLIDTANVYSAGASEALIGEAMPTRKPGMLIATKVRFPMGPGPNDRGLSRAHLALLELFRPEALPEGGLLRPVLWSHLAVVGAGIVLGVPGFL